MTRTSPPVPASSMPPTDAHGGFDDGSRLAPASLPSVFGQLDAAVAHATELPGQRNVITRVEARASGKLERFEDARRRAGDRNQEIVDRALDRGLPSRSYYTVRADKSGRKQIEAGIHIIAQPEKGWLILLPTTQSGNASADAVHRTRRDVGNNAMNVGTKGGWTVWLMSLPGSDDDREVLKGLDVIFDLKIAAGEKRDMYAASAGNPIVVGRAVDPDAVVELTQSVPSCWRRFFDWIGAKLGSSSSARKLKGRINYSDDTHKVVAEISFNAHDEQRLPALEHKTDDV